MSQITLDEIKARQTEIQLMIANFAIQSLSVQYHFPEAMIEIKAGENYAGLILGKDGNQSHHLILLPGNINEVNWTDALAWAKEQGGELPTRREQSLLFANLKEEFKDEYYWSSEQHASYSDYAWFQGFDNGNQNYTFKDNELRARAVRRLIIQ